MPIRRFAILLTTLAVTASLLSACGRRNDPISPYEAALEARKEAREAGEPLPPEPVPPNPDRPFILDRLIQ
jgi:hypothetical protein